MSCRKCEQPAVAKELCKNCFTKYCVKKARQSLNESSGLQRGETLEILELGAQTTIALHLIKKIVGDLPHTMNRVKAPSGTKRVVLPFTAAQVNAQYWEATFKGEDPKLPTGILIFSRLKDEELRTYAKMHSIEDDVHNTNSQIATLLTDLEKKYPGMKRSLLKSAQFLDSL